MHTVEFISVEDEDPDLIVSFALAPSAANSITLIRTPRYESILPEEDRGVSVAAGALGSGERELLVSITFNSSEKSAVIESSKRVYNLSLAHVQPDDILAAKSLLSRMNFDQRFVANAA